MEDKKNNVKSTYRVGSLYFKTEEDMKIHLKRKTKDRDVTIEFNVEIYPGGSNAN